MRYIEEPHEHQDVFLDAIRTRQPSPHLTVDHPDLAVEGCAAAGADILDVHVESTTHIARILTRIRQLGLQPGGASTRALRSQRLSPSPT